jgi:hypothetical protein
MSTQLTSIVEPFVKRGIFESPEKAVTEMARDYVLRQIERYGEIIEQFEKRYGMRYEQFQTYLQARAAHLETNLTTELHQAIMREEEDALNWKIARDSLVTGLVYKLRGNLKT